MPRWALSPPDHQTFAVPLRRPSRWDACKAVGVTSCVMRLSLAIALLFGLSVTGARAADAPAPAVTIAPVQVKDVAPSNSYIGRVQAIQSVAIIARVQAFVEKIDFQEGAQVKAGQLLFELQKAPYQAAVEAAQAGLQRAEA